MSKFHLAQLNMAKARDTINSEKMKGFVNRLDEINALADARPGFVWRLQTEDGDSTSIQAFDDPTLIINMSIWTDIDSLKDFVYKSIHIELVRDRESWFSKMQQVHQVLWWTPENCIPTVEEGKIRLQHLEDNGPSEYAFTFSRPFPMSKL